MKTTITLIAVSLALTGCAANKPLLTNNQAYNYGTWYALGTRCYNSGHISVRDLSDYERSMEYQLAGYEVHNQYLIKEGYQDKASKPVDGATCSDVYKQIGLVAETKQIEAERQKALVDAVDTYNTIIQQNKPVNTNCTTTGMYTNCTTY